MNDNAATNDNAAIDEDEEIPWGEPDDGPVHPDDLPPEEPDRSTYPGY